LQGPDFRYDSPMASDRMMQAIGTLERAVTRLEQDVARLLETPATSPSPARDATAARAALRSLDELIDSLNGRTHG
jgi:hypothetical protein